ncbi:MAG: hypothetical protein IKT58_02105 [Oscillospiraceae bacterium]|nr:hypothetical protein [Oscillospiraceae bacterium]
MKKTILSLTLCLCLLLSSCWMPKVYSDIDEMEEQLAQAEQTTASTEPLLSDPTPTEPSPTEPTEPSQGVPEQEDPASSPLHEYVPYQEYERPTESFLSEVPFSQISYTRPDTQALIRSYAEVQAMVEAQEDVDRIVSAYEEVFEAHTYFNTMHSYAYIRYSLDLNDSYYDTEYNWCEDQSPLLSQAEEKCFVAMAESPLRDALEEAYFEEGFFTFYDENRIYSRDEVVALMQKESDLQSQYMDLQSDMTITWKGQERSVDELMADDSLSYIEYIAVYEAYYNKYNPLCADLYAQLIRVRKEIAKEVGMDSYADFSYAYTYERDFTPEQVTAYCDEIATEFFSLLFSAVMAQASTPSKSLNESKKLFADTVNTLGGALKTAYEFMIDFELWDTHSSGSKLPGSYVTYLSSFEMPFLYVSPTETLSDFTTLVHEFGHFADAYVNCGGTSIVDVAEIFSQGLEFIAMSRADLDPKDRSTLTKSKASDSILVFIAQACYAEFEHLAFSLPDDKLNAEGINELFLKVSEKYGMDLLYADMDQLLAPSWIDVQHFFIAPYYVISYVVSNDVALQIYQQELLEGTGLDLYYDLMLQPSDLSLLELLEQTDMVSPFASGRIGELARFLKSQLSG